MGINRRAVLKGVLASAPVSGLPWLLPSSAATMVKGGTIKIMLTRDFEGFDHVKAPSNETQRSQILFAVHDLLFQYNNFTGELTPRLAVKAEHNDDYTRWTVTLREGVKFSNGEDLTADAYAHHFARLLASPVSGIFIALLGLPLTRVEAPAKHTIQFSFAKPAIAFDVMMGQPLYIWYLNALGFQKENENNPDYNRMSAGAGPYMVKEWALGKSITLVKNPHYWNTEQQHADTLVYPIIAGAERGAPWASLRAGDVDIMFTHGDLIEWGRSQTEFNFISAVRSFIGLQINFNCAREPFNDERVRRALTHAMNREAIANIATSKGNPVAYQAFNPEEKWHYAGLKPLAYDPDKARALLKEYGRKIPPFKLGMLPIGYIQNTAEMIQAMWRDVGLECVISPMGPGPGAMIQAMAKGEYDINLNVGGLTLHPTVFQMNLRSDHSFNFWRIKSPRIDAAIDRVLGGRTDEEIKAAHFELEQAKADEAPVVPIAYGAIGIFSKKDIGGVTKPTSLLYDLHKAYRTQA